MTEGVFDFIFISLKNKIALPPISKKYFKIKKSIKMLL
jgi:hypothetical protein